LSKQPSAGQKNKERAMNPQDFRIASERDDDREQPAVTY
jgi:hypothetical protein